MTLAIFLILLVLVTIFGSLLYGFMYFLEWYKKREERLKEPDGPP